MWVPSSEIWTDLRVWNSMLPLAVLGASLLGSGHCLAMCGGITLTIGKNQRALLSYHLGRLLGYCLLGALAGLLGEATLRTNTNSLVPWISTLFLGVCFIFLGVRLWLGRSLHFFTLPRWFWKSSSDLGPSAMGLASSFLPCGWLHTFVLGAVATQSASLGALYLFFFWIGTVPVLSAGPFLVARILAPISRRVPRLSAIILILVGTGSIAAKMRTSLQPSIHHCHHSTQQ